MMESFPNADDDNNMKYPTLLHNELYFAELVCKTHKRVLHGGINNGLNFIGNEYWLCKGSKRVRALLYKCVACKKSQNETLLGPEPSDHPTFCLTFDYAFSNTRVAFIGPLYIKNVSGKNNQCLKVTYIYCLVRLHGMFILNWHSRRASEGSKDRYLINKRLKVGDGEFRDRNIFTEYFNEINSACGNIDQYNPK